MTFNDEPIIDNFPLCEIPVHIVELTRPKSSASGAFTPSSPASQTLGRGLDVLEQVAAGPVGLGVIASRLGLSRSTVHRLATSLLERRYLSLAPRRGYSLGPKLLELGSLARCQIDLVRAARPVMEALAEATGDAVLLAVRDGDAAVLADSVPGRRRLAPRLHVGERQDLVLSAAGRALLLGADEAELDRVWTRLKGSDAAGFVGSMRHEAETGVALDAAGTDPEIATMAAPIRCADGAVRGVMGIATAATYKEAGLSAPARDALRRAAEAVSHELGCKITNMHDVSAPAETERELLNTRRLASQAPGITARHLAAAAGDASRPAWQGASLQGAPDDDGDTDEDGGMKGRDA